MAGSLSNEPVDLDAILIAVEGARTFTKRDGTTGEMVEAVIGDALGTARVVAWMPELLLNIPAGATVHITGAKPNVRDEGRNYSLDEKSSVAITDMQVSVTFSSLGSVSDRGIYTIQGVVKEVKEPRSFTKRNGATSWVRNIVVGEDDDDLKVVLWGENALIPLSPGDRIEAYHATARAGRFGGIELGVGRGSAFRVLKEVSRPIVFCGTIISGPGCTFIDDGTDRYLIEGGFTEGSRMRVTGILSGSRIIPEQIEPAGMNPDAILAQIRSFRERLAR